MKKTMLLLAVAGLMIAGMASCTKEETPLTPITQTYEVSLRAGEDYTFTLPKNLRNDPYAITTQATHASLSELSVSGSGERVYKYTPAPDFTGRDQMIVSNEESAQTSNSSQGPPPPHGNCSGEQEDHYIITLNFTMEDTVAAASR